MIKKMKKRRETYLRPWGSEKRTKKNTKGPRRISSPGQENQNQKKTKTKNKNTNRRPETHLGPWIVKQKQEQKKFGLPATPSVGARLSGTRDASGVVWAHSRPPHPPNPPRYVKT